MTRVVVTRGAKPGDKLLDGLSDLGYLVHGVAVLNYVEVIGPEIELACTESLDADLWILSSPRAVTRWARVLEQVPKASEVDHPPIVVVGPSTREACIEQGWTPAAVASKSHSEGLVELIRDQFPQGAHIVHPSNAGRRRILEEGLVAAGFRYRPIDLYWGRVEPGVSERIRELAPDVLVVTSAATLEGLVDGWGDTPPACTFVAIGPITAAAFESHALMTHGVAAEPTVSGIHAAICKALEHNPDWN